VLYKTVKAHLRVGGVDDDDDDDDDDVVLQQKMLERRLSFFIYFQFRIVFTHI
jgi:hypothetical protein